MPKENRVTLYDIREDRYPSKRGDEFRSLQVWECPICKARTNRVVIGGWPGTGVRAICPHATACWHHELEAKVALLEQPHPASYRRELEREIAALRQQHAARIRHDLVGKPNLRLVQPVTNTFAQRAHGSTCTHDL
jgi:hypothetical protein